MRRAARFMWLARELRGEADRWINNVAVYERLKRDSHQMLRAVAAAYTTDPARAAELDAFEEAAINMLVRRMTLRGERELAEGATP